MGGLGIAHRPQTGTDLVVGQDPESEVLIEGTVPGGRKRIYSAS